MKRNMMMNALATILLAVVCQQSFVVGLPAPTVPAGTSNEQDGWKKVTRRSRHYNSQSQIQESSEPVPTGNRFAALETLDPNIADYKGENPLNDEDVFHDSDEGDYKEEIQSDDEGDIFYDSDEGNINQEFMSATHSHDLPKMKSLLDGGADPNYRDPKSQWNPLYNVAGMGDWVDRNTMKEAADLLLQNGADVNGRGQSEQTPLIHSAIYKNTLGAQMLLKAGADAKIADKFGQTAFIYADQYPGHPIREVIGKAEGWEFPGKTLSKHSAAPKKTTPIPLSKNIFDLLPPVEDEGAVVNDSNQTPEDWMESINERAAFLVFLIEQCFAAKQMREPHFEVIPQNGFLNVATESSVADIGMCVWPFRNELGVGKIFINPISSF